MIDLEKCIVTAHKTQRADLRLVVLTRFNFATEIVETSPSFRE